jgi:hypothetical protein
MKTINVSFHCILFLMSLLQDVTAITRRKINNKHLHHFESQLVNDNFNRNTSFTSSNIVGIDRRRKSLNKTRKNVNNDNNNNFNDDQSYQSFDSNGNAMLMLPASSPPLSDLNGGSLETIKKNNFRVTSLVGKSITLTCNIDLDEIEFTKAGNYRVKIFNFLKLFFKFLKMA